MQLLKVKRVNSKSMETTGLVKPWVVGQIKGARTCGGLRKSISCFRAETEQGLTQTFSLLFAY